MLMKYADCELAHPKVKGVGFQRYDNYDAFYSTQEVKLLIEIENLRRYSSEDKIFATNHADKWSEDFKIRR